jgi:hypothetical protein
MGRDERLRAGDIGLHRAVTLAYATFSLQLALVLTRRCLLKWRRRTPC